MKDKITFQLEDELKKKFRIKCVEEGKKLGQKLVELVEEWLNPSSHNSS